MLLGAGMHILRSILETVTSWNRGLWSLEYSSKNLESTDDWYPESIFQGQKIRNPVPETVKNPRRGIQNPKLSWISLHGSKLMQNLGDKQIRGIRK